MASLWTYLFALSLAYLHQSESRYSLHLEDTLYLPFEYTPIPRYEFNRNAGGSVRYDQEHKFAYVAGKSGGVHTELDIYEGYGDILSIHQLTIDCYIFMKFGILLFQKLN